MRLDTINTPSYVIDEKKLIDNLKILKSVSEDTGAKILLAQKAYSCTATYSLIGQYLAGTTASGLFEAKLSDECMGKENHVFCPAYTDDEMDQVLKICDHIVFNSLSQYEHHLQKALDSGKSLGLRINPECTTQEGHEIYDPCAKGSRLGVTREVLDKWIEKVESSDIPEINQLKDKDFYGFEGIHFHTLCEQNSDDLKTTLDAVEDKFSDVLKRVKWINMGGGHHITRDDYDIDLLKECINRIKDKYDLEVYLEPGEAIALNAGYLVTTVLDIVENGGIKILILDTSAACHMPDVLEMPYRPPLKDSGEADEKKYTYRLSSCTCLAGDVIGDYSFDREIKIGDRLTFMDMAIYSMVKNNTFNGMPLPDIRLMKENGDCELLKRFGYEDFKVRLA